MTTQREKERERERNSGFILTVSTGSSVDVTAADLTCGFTVGVSVTGTRTQPGDPGAQRLKWSARRQRAPIGFQGRREAAGGGDGLYRPKGELTFPRQRTCSHCHEYVVRYRMVRHFRQMRLTVTLTSRASRGAFDLLSLRYIRTN